MGLSVIIIALNEEQHISDCLASVSFADEVVVLDAGSVDRTIEVAAANGARVEVAAEWRGFGVQKNRALDLATHDWVLSIDADERLTPELAHSIRQAMAMIDGPDYYRMSRSNYFCGRFLNYSGASPDYVTRLFRRGRARFSEDLVHERVVCEGPVGQLEGKLLHYSFHDFSEVLKKANDYSTASARQSLEAGKSATIGKAIGRGLWAFFRSYVLRRGFLDGAHGFAWAVSQAEGTYYRYLKIWRGSAGAGDER